MENNLKIVFLGNPEFALPSLEALVKENYQIIGVITAPDKPVGRKQIITPPSVKVLAQKYRLSVYQPQNKAELLGIIKKLQPDLAIATAFGMIFPKKVLEIPKYGFINIHPSLLPKYRGSTPIQTAILNGDEYTGVSLFLVNEKIDHGKIISNLKFQISNFDTYETLSRELAGLGADLLIETLPKYIDGKITPLLQDESQATYTKKFSTQDAYIEPEDLEKNPLQADRKIRALNPEPGVWTLRQAQGKLQRMKILEAEIIDGKIKLKKIQFEGKKPIQI